MGRVVSCEEKVSLQAVHGASVVGDQFGSEGENDASLPDELMVYEWTHVLSNDWRIVSPSDGY